MVVVHIAGNYGLNNTGGAAIAATRLHLGLLQRGVESHYIAVSAKSDGPNLHILPTNGSILRRLFFKLTFFLLRLGRVSPMRRRIPLNVVPLFGLNGLLAKINPDVVHVHWINNDVMSFRQLANIRYPAVVNLHDMLMINGIEAHPGHDRRYISGFDRVNSQFPEWWIYRRRLNAIKKLKPFFVAPSEWACDLARKSLVCRGREVHCVSNLIDAAFKFDSNLVKSSSKFRILFGAFMGRQMPEKGWEDLIRVIKLLPGQLKCKIEINVFGESGDSYVIDGVSVNLLGPIDDADALKALYHDSDVFALPSHAETQGMTKVEAMMCGLPVITYGRTACGEGIVHCRSGWIAKDGDDISFAEGIRYFYDKWQSGELQSCRMDIAGYAGLTYEREQILNKMLSVYKSVMESFVGLSSNRNL